MELVELVDFIAGERVTAAKLNNNTVRAFSALVTGKPFCHMGNDAAQPIASNATAGAMLLPRIVEDSDAMAEPAANRILIRTPGVWRLTAQMTWTTNTAGYRHAAITRNFVSMAAITGPPANGASTRFNLSTPPIRCTGTESFQLWAAQTSGATLNTDPAHGGVFLSAEWLRA